MSDHLRPPPSSCERVPQVVHDMVFAKMPGSEEFMISLNMLIYLEWLTHTALFNNVVQADGNTKNGIFYDRGWALYSAMGEDVRIALCECLGEHYKLFPPKAAGTRRVTLGQSVQEPPSITNDDVATTRTLSSRWRRPGKSAAQVQAKVDIILPHNVRKVILIPLFLTFQVATWGSAMATSC